MMDALAPLLVVIIAWSFVARSLAKVSKAAKKTGAKKTNDPAGQTAAGVRSAATSAMSAMTAASRAMRAGLAGQNAKPAEENGTAFPAEAFPETKSAPAAEPAMPEQPVRAPMVPTLRESSFAGRTEPGEYLGSLGGESPEGVDPCHDEQMVSMTAAREAPRQDTGETKGLTLSWTGEDIVRGFVMGEILNRRNRAASGR